MTEVSIDRGEMAAFLRSAAVVADVEVRGQRVRETAARRAGEVSHRWAAAMDTETAADEFGAYVDVSWRHGTGQGEAWFGHFLEFGHDHVPAHPALRGALDAAAQD